MAASGLQFRKVELLIEDLDRLATLPGIAARLLPVVCAPKPVLREALQIVQGDPALASRLIAVANSGLETGEPRTRTIFSAVERLGTDVALADLLAAEVCDNGLDIETIAGFWRHSLATAISSQMIATRLVDIDPDEALAAGLLHDIGQLALAQLLPRSYKQVLAEAGAGGHDLIDAERTILGIDHTVVGKRMAGRWRFPDSLVAVIWHHHQAAGPLLETGPAGRLVRLVHLADLLACQCGYRFGQGMASAQARTAAAEELGFSDADMGLLGQKLRRAYANIAPEVGISGPCDPQEYHRALAQANRRLGRLNLAAAANARDLSRRLQRSELLLHAGSELATCREPRVVLQTIGRVVLKALDSETVVVYSIGPNCEYVEGVRMGAGENGAEAFFYEMDGSESLEEMPWESHGGAVLMRAERSEGWLFERMGPALGRGPFYAVPMLDDGNKIGGFVFSKGPVAVDGRTADELAALAGMGALALKRAQAEAGLIRMTEESVEITRRLHQAQDELLRQRSMATVGEMAAGAAHEINNPLAIISGRAQQLLGDEEAEDRKAMLQSIADAAQRASDIVLALREFARPSQPNPREVDPAAIIAKVVEQFSAAAREAQVELGAAEAGGVPQVHVDADQIADAGA
ncbi:MAG: HDOD domain-containing protein, partial [Planctomycetia bacterium]|nr:HDOD domain-containing protein [Planctomycetia bacterium]